MMDIDPKEIKDGVSINNTIGNNLKYLMQKNNINNIELANDLGMSCGTINKIIHGKMKPSPLTLFYLAEYFRVSTQSFYKNDLNEIYGQKEAF